MQRKEMLNPYETAAGAAIVAIVGGVIAYLQSIWKKALKSDADAIQEKVTAQAMAETAAALAAFRTDVDRRLETIDRRNSAWEQRASQFVTREMWTELERKIDKMETRIEASVNKLTDRLDKLLEGRN